jgi:hypothetical protein
MTIVALFAEASFDPETVSVLAAAFDAAWDSLQRSGSALAADSEAALTRELLAERIIELARRGERDPQRLVEGALAYLAGRQPIGGQSGQKLA